MRKAIVFVALFALIASTAFGAAFAPTVLKISAPSQVVYKFDGSTLSIPVTLTGAPASTYFMVFTKDQGTKIGTVRNGYLGWHYVNKIDTCVYLAQAVALTKGSNTINWNGKGEGGTAVPKGTYTYYLWGFDNVNPKTLATSQLTPGWEGRDMIFDTNWVDGKPLANPLIYSATYNGSSSETEVDYTRTKWKLGNDPADATLKETTKYKTYCENSSIAFAPGKEKIFFNQTHNNVGTWILRQWEWVPNGDAILQTKFGDNGQATWPSKTTKAWSYMGGPQSDGKGTIFCTDADLSGVGDFSNIWYFDATDGSTIRKVDISEWWVKADEGGEHGGQLTGGPTDLMYRNGWLICSSHSCCMFQMMQPANESDADATIWTNGNGDWVGDHNFQPDAKNKWFCNDYNVAPYSYSSTIDANGFVICPAYDMGAVSFSFFAPDGTGIGYPAYAGETASYKWIDRFVDSGSAFDGIYMDNSSSSDQNAKNGWWFVAQDSFKGVISDQVAVADAAPAAFAVAQNTPNPFNPTTTINFTIAKAGKVTVDVFNSAGQKVDTIANAQMTAGSHSVNWNAAKFSAGVYFCTVKSGSLSKTVKMTLLK